MNPFESASEPKKRMTLIGIYLGVIANLMVSTTNATLFPVAALDLNAYSLYGLAQSVSGVLGVCVMPIFGFLGARKPHIKRLLVGGGLLTGALVVFVRALAPDFRFIVVSNVFWGAVSAGIFVVGFTIIRDMFDQKRAGFYLGLNGTMMSVAMIAGPFLGGLVIDNVGWRAWCWVVFAILMCAFVLVTFFGIKVTKEEAIHLAVKGKSFDFAGGVAVTVFLAMLILALSLGRSAVPFGSTASTCMVVVGLVALIALVVVVSKKGDDAIVPRNAIMDRSTLVLSGNNFLHNIGNMSVSFFVPAFVMMQLIDDPLVGLLGAAVAGGLVTVFRAIPGLFLGPVWGKMIAKDGSARRVLTIGNVTRVLVMAAFLLTLTPNTPSWVIFLVALAAGIYTSNMTVAMSAGPQIQLKHELRVTGNSVVQLGQNLGGGIGTALFTGIVAADPVGGMTVSMIVALVCAVAQVFLGLLLEKKK